MHSPSNMIVHTTTLLLQLWDSGWNKSSTNGLVVRPGFVLGTGSNQERVFRETSRQRDWNISGNKHENK